MTAFPTSSATVNAFENDFANMADNPFPITSCLKWFCTGPSGAVIRSRLPSG